MPTILPPPPAESFDSRYLAFFELVRAFIERIRAQNPAPGTGVTGCLDLVLANLEDPRDTALALQRLTVTATLERASLRGWNIHRAPSTDRLYDDLTIATLHLLSDYGDDPRGEWWAGGQTYLEEVRRGWPILDTGSSTP